MDKLFFYSQSKDVYPGEGINEIVKDKSQYIELSKIKDWRKILSNFHECKFKYEGYTYDTIEHAFQAKKISLVDKDKAYLFTVESGSNIGIGDGNVARKNRKLVILNENQLQQWNKIKEDVMYQISLEKYKVCEQAMDVLLKTNKAELWHVVSRSPNPIRFTHLEKIRSNYIIKTIKMDTSLRPLTQKEIDYIIHGLDPVKYREYLRTRDESLKQLEPVFKMRPGTSNPLALQSYALNMKYLRKQLANVKLILPPSDSPSALGPIEKFRMMITKKYLKSLIAPGSNVGIQAADALGAPITQMTLNSFHNSGKRVNTTTGIERMKEILHATKNMKARVGKIIFKNPPKSFNETLNYRRTFVDMKIIDVIDNENSEIMPYDEFMEFIDRTNKRWILDTYKLQDSPMSYDKILNYKNDRFKTYVGVYKLDKYKLYTYRITMNAIIKAISLVQEADMIYIIPSDIYDPYLFVFFDKKFTSKMNYDFSTDNACFMFLSDFIYKKIFNINLSVPNGVKKIFVSEVNVNFTDAIWIDKSIKYDNDTLFYAESEGINLLTVLGKGGVDAKRTHSNDPQQIKEVLGIEAARYSICDEIQNVIKEAGEISLRHLLLLVDYMTYMGTITPISIIGASSKDEGTLLAASRVKATETIASSAITNSFDVKTPTLEIAFGTAPNVGSKTMGVVVDKDFDYSCPIPKYPKQLKFEPMSPITENDEPVYVEDKNTEEITIEDTNDIILVKPLSDDKPKIIINTNKSFNIPKLLGILKEVGYGR